MITDILAAITHFITSTIDTWGYVGVGVLMAIESAAIPLPSEIIIPFAGVSVGSGRFTLFGLALAGGFGSVLGSLVTYAVGFYGGRPLIQKYGRWVFISEHDLASTEKFFAHFGKWSSLIGRVLPVVRTFISIPAGIGKEPLLPFTIFAFVGSFIWSYFLAWLGLKLGNNWHILETYFRKFDIIIVAAGVIFVIYWVHRHWQGRMR